MNLGLAVQSNSCNENKWNYSMCTQKEVYLSAIQSYLQFSPYFTHTKKCKKFYITMWNTYNTRTNVILKKKMHTLKFVSTVTLYLKVKSPRSSTDKIVAFIAIEKSFHLKQMKTTKPWKNTYKLISRRRTHLKLNSDKCTCIF